MADVMPDCCDEEGKKVHVGQVEGETTISAKLVWFPCVSIPAQNYGRGDNASGTQKCMTCLEYVQGVLKVVIRVLTAVQKAEMLEEPRNIS